MKCSRIGMMTLSKNDEPGITTDISGVVGWLMKKIGILV